jgi:hypothetical protein
MEQQQLANSAAMGLMAGIGLGIFFMLFAIGIFFIVCYWKIFTKAGQPGWAIFVPFYSLFVFLRIINKPWWYFFLFMIPIYGWFILPIICVHRLSLSFGKSAGFTLGLIFISIVFVPILAFDNSTYTKLAD